MEQLLEFFRKLLESDQFMPRWVCGKWTPFHGWLYIISDLVIFAAYMAIPVAMVYFVRKRWGDLPFRRVFWLFIAFIALCGTTHLMDAIIFYVPHYRLNALVLVATAIVSVVTVVSMAKVMPEALAYKSPLELQQAVDQKTLELNLRVHQLDRMTDRISRKKEQVERFAYITSHNLRSPAANLYGLIQLLSETKDAEKSREITDRMLKSGEQLLDTLDDISQVLVESSPLLPATSNNFETLIKQIELEFQREIVESGVSIIKDFRYPDIIYPRDHLKSIISNLLSNAIRYRHPDRPLKIMLTTWKKNGQIFMQCEDNGLGIDLAQHGHTLFHLYKTFHGHPEGKGIGLFLIRHQLESMDGEINVESTPGEGTTFTVRFGKITPHIV
jgi:chemotaxis family two-component system sensor kinase Cph1